MNKKTNNQKTARVSSRANQAAFMLPAKPTTVDDFDDFGRFEILRLMREIKQIAGDNEQVMAEFGDKLWRLADCASQIIEG